MAHIRDHSELTNRLRSHARVQTRRMFRASLHGELINTIDGPNGSILEFWSLPGGHVVIVQMFAEGGWQYYMGGRENQLPAVHTDITKYYL